MKTFPISLEDNLHKQIKKASIEKDMTIHDWIISSIKNQLIKEGFFSEDKIKIKKD